MAASPLPGCPSLAGNPDLYGVGVGVGLYAQWAATLATSVLHPADESALRLLNLIVQTAMLVGLCAESARRASAVGALVTQILLCGSLSSVTGDGVVHFGHEYLIRANDVQGVGVQQIGSVAQLIPLLSGSLACFLSCWQVLTRRLLFRKR